MLLSTEPPVTFSKISEPLATHQVNLLRLWMQFAAFTCRYLLFDFSASCYTFFLFATATAANCRWAHKKLPNALVHLPKWQRTGLRGRWAEVAGQRVSWPCPPARLAASCILNFQRKAKLAALPPLQGARFVYDPRHLTLHFLWPRKKIAHISRRSEGWVVSFFGEKHRPWRRRKKVNDQSPLSNDFLMFLMCCSDVRHKKRFP